MRKLYYICVVLNLVLIVSGCSEKSTESPATTTKIKLGDISMHPETKLKPGEEKSGLAQAVKGQTLPDYPEKTIGKALDGYVNFTKREWKETFASQGKIYLDFIGWLKVDPLDTKNIAQGVSAKGVSLKFLLIANEPFKIVMVSRVEVKTDGKLYEYPMPDIKAVLDSIYSNKEIVL